MTDIQRRFNTEMDLAYQTNEEYRAKLRYMFYMDISMCALNLEAIDEETRDELTYDEKTVSSVMDELFTLTKDHALFQKLYDSAAEKMFSTDRDIGMAVLFSFDYLPFFYKCLVVFLKTPYEFTETNAHYVSLWKKIV